jgi:hypothetical protein
VLFLNAFLVAAALLVGSPGSSDCDSEWNIYTNDEFQVILHFPTGWQPDPANPRGRRYQGPDGFFQLEAAAGNGASLYAVAQSHASHHLQPFGALPSISPTVVAGQPARLSWPSDGVAGSGRGACPGASAPAGGRQLVRLCRALGRPGPHCAHRADVRVLGATLISSRMTRSAALAAKCLGRAALGSPRMTSAIPRWMDMPSAKPLASPALAMSTAALSSVKRA